MRIPPRAFVFIEGFGGSSRFGTGFHFYSDPGHEIRRLATLPGLPSYTSSTVPDWESPLRIHWFDMLHYVPLICLVLQFGRAV